MAVTVVQLLEVVEIADDEPERAVVPERARDLALEPFDEPPAVHQTRQGIVIGEEPQLAQVRRRDDRSSRLVREDAHCLQRVARRKQPVLRLVGPEHADHLAEAVVQRDEQPVVIPRPWPAPVQRRRVRLP